MFLCGHASEQRSSSFEPTPDAAADSDQPRARDPAGHRTGSVVLRRVQAMKTACKEVLSAIDGESWETVQIPDLDIDDVLRRFETLRAMKFSTGSLGTYKSRFKKSVAMFKAFQDNPSAWRPDVKPRNRGASQSARAATSGPSALHAPTNSHQPSSSTSVITYPFPLREDVLVSLQLPADLTKRDVQGARRGLVASYYSRSTGHLQSRLAGCSGSMRPSLKACASGSRIRTMISSLASLAMATSATTRDDYALDRPPCWLPCHLSA